jgi:hypothetical protein
MDRRLQLDNELREVLQEAVGYVNLYYQPPASVRMQYDAIRYEETTMYPRHADDRAYLIRTEYQVIVISRDPDSPIPRMIQERFPLCRPGRKYAADNLYHYPFTIYY